MLEFNKSVLPKLLAKENITVKHGNYPTAWFNIKDRELGLPLWKDMGKDVYDLLIGHEVGHALETPYEGWHDSPEKLEGCPRSYINVVEDARIERKIQLRYAGLVGPMTRGYKVLLDQKFFGDIDNIDWSETKLIDKINLKTKLRNMIEVPFTAEEDVLYQRACTTETFDEVVQLVKDIYGYTKTNQKELLQQPDITESNDNTEDQEDQMSMGHDDMEKNDEQEETDQDEQQSSSPETEQSDEESEEEGESKTATTQPEHTEDVSITDEIFRGKEKELVDTDQDGKQPNIIQQCSQEDINSAIISHKELAKNRAVILENIRKEDKAEESAGWHSHILNGYDKANEEYPAYIKEVKKSVANAVREFEMKKAATRWAKASVSKSGNLDVNKLWSYKTNEDIFLRTTRLANAKDHGMVMLIDFSGSMSGSMKYVMDQVIHTIMFCKGINVPFEVYAFTTEGWRYESTRRFKAKDGQMDMDELSMPLLASSEMKKAELDTAIRALYQRVNQASIHGWGTLMSKWEGWGSTPLNQALIVAHDIVKRFVNKHNIEKMNFITFTDGDANHVRAYREKYIDTSYKTKIIVQGKVVECENGRKSMTEALLKNIGKRYNTNNIGFFMADSSSEWRHRLNDVMWSKGTRDLESAKKQISAEYRKNKCVEFSNVYGYSTYYMVKGGSTLDTSVEDFDVNQDASDTQIRTAFKKFAKSKKTNKVIMTKFGSAVA